MGNVIVFLLLALLIGGAVVYIIRAKKRGVKCIGCSAGGSCASCVCGCGSQNGQKDDAKNKYF